MIAGAMLQREVEARTRDQRSLPLRPRAGGHPVLELQRAAGNQAVARLMVARLAVELETEADALIEAVSTTPAQVDLAALRRVYAALTTAYEGDDADAGMKRWELESAAKGQAVVLVRRVAAPLLATIKGRLAGRLGSRLPAALADLESWGFAAGEGISGGVAVGVGLISITPGTATELLFGGSLEFALAHEVAHTVKGVLPEDVWPELMRTDQQLRDTGVAIEGREQDLPHKLEEVRADVFGAESLAAHLGKAPGELGAAQVKGAIDAPADAEHPSTEERMAMLTQILGIQFPA
jgi:hypothetical protein